MSMPDYVSRALVNFQDKLPSPSPTCLLCMGLTCKWPENTVCSCRWFETLWKNATKLVQAIAGTFLYYARAVDPNILPALEEIANIQAKPTEKTVKAYRACQMVIISWSIILPHIINWCVQLTFSPRPTSSVMVHTCIGLPVHTSIHTRSAFHLLPKTNHQIKRKPKNPINSSIY